MTIKKLPKSQIEFEMSVSWEDWKKHLEKAVKEASEELKIPGFRPGHAPKNLVEQKAGKAYLLNVAAQYAVEKSYADFVTREKLDVIGSPKVEVGEIEEGKELKYTATVSVMPEVEIKNGYKKDIGEINREYAGKKNEISEDDVNLELEKLANSRVKLVTVRREAKKGDSVEIDFEVSMDGAAIENGKSEKHPLVLGKGVFIPGFEEKIIGMKEEEEKEFVLNFPADYHKKDLAGKEAVFKVKLRLVQERQIPEISDEFAKSLGKFDNLDSLKKSVREGLELEGKNRQEEERKSKQVEKIVENSVADIPDVLIREELHGMLGEFEGQIAGTGMKIDEYLSKIKKTREDLEKEWEPQAKKRIISGLAMKKIAQEENIEVKSEEVEKEMNKVLQYYKGVKDLEKNINMERLYNYSKGVLENEKVFEVLNNF